MQTLTIDFEFRNQIIDTGSHAKTLSACYQCGTCTGGCPAAKVTNGAFNPRKLIINSLLGLKEKLVQTLSPNVWLCTTCQKCVESCPQGVELTEIFNLLKNMSVDAKTAPVAFVSQGQTIFETGFTIPIQKAIQGRRERNLGLELRKEAPVDEVQTLLKAVGWDAKFPTEEPAETGGEDK